MLVSWNWLKDYVSLDVPAEELETRLMMAGLNHEGTTRPDGDVVIDLEVTSNRPDCLGHIGVAREAAVLLGQPLKIPDPQPAAEGKPVADLTSVAIECPDLCFRYTARLIRGVKIGPSPSWLTDRLTAIGVTAINNVVDVTNYVLFECGQPLHAFDFAKLRAGRIIVREAKKGEKFEAIDHRSYDLDAGMCVIADADRPVALGGVMGGADTEVSTDTTDLLIESAEFAPVSIRGTARKLNLDSPSSFRFERGVDPVGIDWASRRCCELVLDLAGGELAEGVIDIGESIKTSQPVSLRFAQLTRILGIEVDSAEARRILTELGCEERAASADRVEVVPPSWRRELTREIDLVEEVARIHGYDQIPEDVGVAMVASSRSDRDRVLDRVRSVLTAAGMNEAMTLSAVDRETSELFSPWTDAAAIEADTPVIHGANFLRRSLAPSLLRARRINETVANPRIELFEIAQVYWPQTDGLPTELTLISLTSGGDFQIVKGIVEAILEVLHVPSALQANNVDLPLVGKGRASEISIDGHLLGYLGELSPAGLDAFDLRGPTTIAELRLDALIEAAQLIPKAATLSDLPAVNRDLNVVFDESVRWADVESIVRREGGELVERVVYQDTYRDEQRLGLGKKSLLVGLELRSQTDTLTGQQADTVVERIVNALASELAGELRA